MEPRLFSRGNHESARYHGSTSSLLQWSHDYLVVETMHSAHLSQDVFFLQWSHDYLVVETCWIVYDFILAARPSMEPRLFSRGNSYGIRIRTPGKILQWSHDYLVVETQTSGYVVAIDNSFNGATTI